jgi:hypothetical protein
MKKIALFVTCAILCLNAFAEETRTPTDAFRGETQYHAMMCQLKVRSMSNKIELEQAIEPEDSPGKCIKDGKASAKKFYAKALSSVSKNPAASRLLKDYYAVWLTAINGVLPNVSETKVAYGRRQEAIEARYDEIWNRFEIEAGI